MTQDPIRPGDTVKLTDEAYRAAQPNGGFKNGTVVELRDDLAVVDWLDPALPREVELAALEKVVRKKPAAGWVNKAGGFEVGDPVCLKASFLRSTGQTIGEAGFLRGKITGLKPMGEVTLATIEWSDGTTQKAVTANLSKVTVRGISDE